jgi:hypothetical protein
MPLSNSSVAVSFPTSNVATRTVIAASVTSVSLVSSNPARKGITIWNNSTANLYIDFGANPSTSSFAVKISADGYYELPYSYTGSIGAIWDAANGSALVRELT